MTARSALLGRLRPGPRFHRWLLERMRRKRGPLDLPCRLVYRNIYVLPSTFGWGFALMLLTLGLGGLNFNNNLSLLLVFTLATLAVTSIVLAHHNLVGLRIDRVWADPVFAGEEARFSLALANSDERSRFAIRGELEGSSDCLDLAPGTNETMVLRMPTQRRGWLDIGPVRLETRYPLGMFYAWSWLFPRARCLVWPRPARNPPPLPRTGERDGVQARRGDGDQVHSLRDYRYGDSLRKVAWKTSARHDRLLSLEMETPREDACELNWFAIDDPDPEQRLSVLTAWVLEAERQQIPYALVLPSGRTPTGLGSAHWNECLERLALYPA
ncbi:MAG: DUF58 domain-containing protein [Xanthomonadales bacterium]|nr:DUF58 domain-containing protein [Xanthomonadales bacterium]